MTMQDNAEAGLAQLCEESVGPDLFVAANWMVPHGDAEHRAYRCRVAHFLKIIISLRKCPSECRRMDARPFRVVLVNLPGRIQRQKLNTHVWKPVRNPLVLGRERIFLLHE